MGKGKGTTVPLMTDSSPKLMVNYNALPDLMLKKSTSNVGIFIIVGLSLGDKHIILLFMIMLLYIK